MSSLLPNNEMSPEPKTAPTSNGGPQPVIAGLRYLALGDSYTIGESVSTSERFPSQLVRRLRARSVEIRSPQIIARTGWTTADLAAAVAQGGAQEPFDLVSLLIGVNNQYRGLELAQYRVDMGALIDQAIEFAGGDPRRVLVISIPDWGAMPYARNFDRGLITQQIDAFNKAAREMAARRGARYIDITPLSRRSAEDSHQVAKDGLHPSGKQYQAWVDLLLPEAMSALGH